MNKLKFGSVTITDCVYEYKIFIFTLLTTLPGLLTLLPMLTNYSKTNLKERKINLVFALHAEAGKAKILIEKAFVIANSYETICAIGNKANIE